LRSFPTRRSSDLNITGQKADLILWMLRPTIDELNTLELEFNKLAISDFLIPSYSYVSVIELSNYLAKDSDEDPYQNEHVRKRLYPRCRNQANFSSIRWTSVAKATTTGTCSIWKNAVSSCTHTA